MYEHNYFASENRLVNIKFLFLSHIHCQVTRHYETCPQKKSKRYSTVLVRRKSRVEY